MDEIHEVDSGEDSLEQDYFDEDEMDQQSSGDSDTSRDKQTDKIVPNFEETHRQGTHYGGKVLEAASGGHYYKVGVIDFLTKHGAMKTLETNVKSALFNVRRESISA